MPRLVPAAAEGLIVVTVCATVLHVMAAEYSSAAITFVLLLMANLLAHGRWLLRHEAEPQREEAWTRARRRPAQPGTRRSYKFGFSLDSFHHATRDAVTVTCRHLLARMGLTHAVRSTDGAGPHLFLDSIVTLTGR
jgi:hypothetical protein